MAFEHHSTIYTTTLTRVNIFIKMVKDVGMDVPNSIQTMCSMQAKAGDDSNNNRHNPFNIYSFSSITVAVDFMYFESIIALVQHRSLSEKACNIHVREF